MFVRVQRNPVKIPSLCCFIVLEMSKIENLEQFKLVKKSNLGFIVFSDNTSKTIHQNKCDVIGEDKFTGNDSNEFHWFSTIAMAEKSFSLVLCDICKPSD